MDNPLIVKKITEIRITLWRAFRGLYGGQKDGLKALLSIFAVYRK